MNVADALHDAWNEARGPAPSSVAGLVAALGGTKSAAGVLGVAQRTVERYINREQHGASKSNRQISAANKEKLTAEVDRRLDEKAAARVREHGMTAEAEGDVKMSSRGGHRSISEQLEGARLGEMLDAITRGAWDAAAEEFEDVLFDFYGVPGMRFATDGVDELQVHLPA